MGNTSQCSESSPTHPDLIFPFLLPTKCSFPILVVLGTFHPCSYHTIEIHLWAHRAVRRAPAALQMGCIEHLKQHSHGHAHSCVVFVRTQGAAGPLCLQQHPARAELGV